MYMKYFRTSIVILLALLFTLPGCNNRNDNRILLWTPLRPVEREYLQTLLDKFGKDHPEYQFQQLYYEPEELRTNFIISSLAGKGPDLIHMASDNIGPLSELEVIMPLEGFFEKAFLDSFITEPFTANTWLNGHLYQISDRVGNHLSLVYNKQLVKEPPRTMSELIEMGKKLVHPQDGSEATVRYALAWNYIEPFFAVPFIGGYGGWLFDEDLNPTLNTPAVVNASQLIYDLANKHRIIPIESNYETSHALFMDGQSAMIINGPWSWATYIKNGLDIGLARIPMIDETGLWPTPMVSPLGYMVNVNLDDSKSAVVLKLIRFLTSEEIQLDIARKFNLIPSRRLAAQDSVLQQDPFFKAAVDQMMVGREMPVITELRWVWDAMRPAYQSIFTGGMTPTEAAEDMQRLAEKLISENR